MAPTGLLHHGQQVRLREGEKEKERRWGRGAEEAGKGERCLRPLPQCLKKGIWPNAVRGRVRIYICPWLETTPPSAGGGPAGPQNHQTTLHSPLSLLFSFSPMGWALLSPLFFLFFSPSLHSPPQSPETQKREQSVSDCYTHTILGSGYDASWDTESLEPPVPPSSCPCALHTLSAVQNPGQIFNKKENLDFKDAVVVTYYEKIN